MLRTSVKILVVTFMAIVSVNAAPNGGVTGTITEYNSSGTPVPNAIVSVKKDATGSTAKKDTCDNLGKYTIANLSTGKYIRTISLTGYITFVDTFEITSGTDLLTKDAELHILIYGSIAGNVTEYNTSGTPVPQAIVVVKDIPGVITKKDTCSATGAYKIDSLMGGKYIRTISLTGYVTFVDTFEITSSGEMTKDAELHILIYGSIAGTVTEYNSSGTPVPKAIVAMQQDVSGGIVKKDTCSDLGAYKIDSLLTGVYIRTISLKGYITLVDTFEITSSGEMTRDAELHIMYYNTLEGTISDTVNGAPVANATVTLLQGTNIIKKDTTGADGNYKFDSVSTGTYSIKVTATAYTQARTVTVDFPGTSMQTVDISFKIAGIYFSVKNAGLRPAKQTIGLTANKILRLNNFPDAGVVHVYDLSGRKILSTAIPSGMAHFDVPLSNAVASGHYTVSVTQKKSTSHYRIVLP